MRMLYKLVFPSIIDGRPYIAVDEMVDVCGIGLKTLGRMKPYVEVIPAEK